MHSPPDFELIRTRLSLLELLKSFFAREPDGELIASWRGALPILRDESGIPGLAAHALDLILLLQELDLNAIKEEFHELFIDPFSESYVNTNTCYYIDGSNFGESFLRLREIMARAMIEKGPDAVGSEDELPIVLDTYQQLIECEKKTPEPDKIKELQKALLKEILQPFSIAFSRSLAENTRARFYESCAHLLREGLILEEMLFL